LGDRISFGEAARNYHVDKGDVQKWVAAYQAYGMAGIIKQRISYPGKFKQEVIEDMRANNLSLRETAAKFNLGNHGVVANWERIYMEEGTEGLYVERRGKADSASVFVKVVAKIPNGFRVRHSFAQRQS
jgi:transposase